MFLLWECSTPFVFMRWGLHALGRTNSKLYLYNGLTMMAVFFLCRNVMGVGEPHSFAVPCAPQKQSSGLVWLHLHHALHLDPEVQEPAVFLPETNLLSAMTSV